VASPAIPLSERPLSERAFVALNRRALDAERHPVVRLDEDMRALDAATGSRRGGRDALRQLVRDGRLRRVRIGFVVAGAMASGRGVGERGGEAGRLSE